MYKNMSCTCLKSLKDYVVVAVLLLLLASHIQNMSKVKFVLHLYINIKLLLFQY